MQTRKENLDHHQVPFPKKEAEHSSPEAELIALAQSKHQVLAEHASDHPRNFGASRSKSLGVRRRRATAFPPQ